MIKSQVSASETADLCKMAWHQRTDTGSVKISLSSMRKEDGLIRDTQRYKNICSENEKIDYMTSNFCKDKPQKKVSPLKSIRSDTERKTKFKEMR